MESLYLLLASLFVAGLITWRLLIGSTREKLHETRAAHSVSPMPSKFPEVDERSYAAVSLQICNRPCASAMEMRGKTVLQEEAPRLPLQGCDRACNCRFRTHEDRRLGKDRRTPDQVYLKTMGQPAFKESREGRDRRRRGRFQYSGIY